MWGPSNSIEPSRVCRTLSRLLLYLAFLLYSQTEAAYRHLNGETTFGQYCENEVFNASCKTEEVVIMTRAHYGRKALTGCVKEDFGHIGCFGDVLEQTDSRCSGRRQCNIRVPLQFKFKSTCPDDLKPYLEADYKCVKVETAPAGFCHSHQPIPLLTTTGYLASLVTEATGCGGSKTPWLIQGKPGQTIRLTLYDFNVAESKLLSEKGSGGSYSYPRCILYANITETKATRVKRMSICGGLQREKVVYTSDTNAVEVSILAAHTNTARPYFLFQYEVIGCPDLAPIKNSWSLRSGNGVMVKCNFTDGAYHLKCINNVWEGTLGNCTKVKAKPIGGEQEAISIPYGLSILIVLAIALLIGLFVLFVGLMFLRRQRGLCAGGQDEAGSDTVAPSETLEKEYIRHTWPPQSQAGDVSNLPKGATWRDAGGPYATYSTELPPCTPLMDRQNKPPLYGQLQQKLPCGCPTYITGTESNYDVYDFEAENQENRQRVVMNPGEPTRYFVLDPQAVASQVQQVQASQSSLPIDDSASDKPVVTQPGKTQSPQTDDVKLRLREGPAIICQTKPLPIKSGASVQEPKPVLSTFKQKDETYTVICKDMGGGEVQSGLSQISLNKQ